MRRKTLPPFLMTFNDDAGGGGAAPPAPAAPAAPVPPAPAATPPASDGATATNDTALAALQAKLDAANAEAAAHKDKAAKFDAAEAAKLSDLEREQKRASDAEALAASNAAELLQLRAATEHGITKEERALLTGTTEETLNAQVAAVLKLRAPATASAQTAGITGGGAAPKSKPNSMEEAFAAHYSANAK